MMSIILKSSREESKESNASSSLHHCIAMKWDRITSCPTCNSRAPHQQRQPLQQPPPALAWTSMAADIFEWRSKHYLVVADSYSNWFELDLLTSITSELVIRKLKKHFSTFGSPVRLQTDNGRQFTSHDFKPFANRWNFHHVMSSPEYPQSNGLAERAVRSAKQLME
ncbi:uncharacterized protein K02A2.6-like [Amblyraja radiata]|uniref:uncharacterized protein K02A2.6-like n=1 Tax=Amblyraja radiata TaxID=386614 RepID=UPI001402E970|nr:uncharacterized protein K02A2.6-like [Amblyraja radiata]